MKKTIKLLSLLAFGFSLQLNAQNNAELPCHFEIIANADKSINYTIGVYPTLSEYVRNNNGNGYTKMRIAVINNSKQELKWNDYKIYILMKNGDLFYNYTTATKEGELSCNYVVKPDESHIQYVCFEKDFDINQIQKIYLSILDNKFFPLVQSDCSNKK
jgi:hypothetical protein